MSVVAILVESLRRSCVRSVGLGSLMFVIGLSVIVLLRIVILMVVVIVVLLGLFVEIM
jgi:hypothetical protein